MVRSDKSSKSSCNSHFTTLYVHDTLTSSGANSSVLVLRELIKLQLEDGIGYTLLAYCVHDPSVTCAWVSVMKSNRPDTVRDNPDVNVSQ